MTFDDYQKAIIKFDTFPQSENLRDPGYLEKILGLTGEAGEVAEKFKKAIRDKAGKITTEDKKEIAKELGDCLWYLATLARYLNLSFSEVAQMNIDKLQSRLERNQLRGSGDNR